MGMNERLKKYGFLFQVEVEYMPGIGPLEPLLIPGEELQKQREALHMTQQQVADKAGINIRQYQRFESGERSFYSTTLRIGLNICHVLKIDPFYYCTIRHKIDPVENYEGEPTECIQANNGQKYVLYSTDEDGSCKDLISVEYGASIDTVYDKLTDAIREEMSEELGLNKGEIDVYPYEELTKGQYRISGAPTVYSGQEPPHADFTVIET